MFDDFEDGLIDEEDMGAMLAGAGLVPPRQMKECLGHTQIEQKIIQLNEEGKLPHAMIFAGPRGIGKATMAFRLARYLLKTGKAGVHADGGLFGDELPKETPQNLFIDPDENIFRQVASGGHPDLITIERLFDEKKGRHKGNVEVDEVRRIAPFMRMTASQGGWRIAIIDDADTMNRNAQNAILKILEEPPAHALLILVCHRLGAMIPTIRSRCRVISFTPPTREDFAALIGKDHGGLPQTDMDVLYNIAGGSVGRGLQIAEEGGLEAIEKIMGLLYGWPKWQWSQIHTLADTMSRPGQDQSLQAFQDVLLWIIDSLTKAKARNQTPQSPLDNEATQTLLDHYSLEDWIEISGSIRGHFDTVTASNLDKRHAVLGAFSLFKEAA